MQEAQKEVRREEASVRRLWEAVPGLLVAARTRAENKEEAKEYEPWDGDVGCSGDGDWHESRWVAKPAKFN